MIQFTCECGKLLQAKEEYSRRQTRCPDCGRDLLIPNVGEGTEAVGTPRAPTESPAASGVAGETRETFDNDDYEAPSSVPGQKKTSGKAVASLILGIGSFICSVFTGIPAIILGVMSLRNISMSRGRVQGQGLAIAGIVTGAAGMILMLPVVAVLVGLLLPAVQKVREAANRMQCQNNLKQLALAMHNYHDVNGKFPPAVVLSKDGKPLYSWRVLLLPYMEEQPLYKQFKLDEPWDSPNNIRLLDQMPKVFTDPSARTDNASSTVYQVLVGPGTAFENPEGERMLGFTDGLSNTILIVEAAQAVPWTKPDDLSYAANRPLPQFGTHHSNGFNAAFADGAIRFISNSVNEQVLRALITRNGGEDVRPP